MSTSNAFTPTAMPTCEAAPAVRWLPWTRTSFERAAHERKPVLLSITTAWCHGCAVMDRTCYEDAGIAATINHRFVPVRVDADRRPDVHDRYNLEGLPTTAFLTPSGEILTGSTYLPPERLASLLVEVADAYESRGAALEERAAAAAASRRAQAQAALPIAVDPDLAAPAWIARQVVEGCDPEFGGFGTGGKFLHVPALRVAVAEYASTREPSLAQAIALTLDGMAQGAVHDPVEGGFFRYASARDWTKPHTEKLIEDQAGIVRLYLEAADVFHRADWRDVARETIGFVTRTLADPGGAGFYASLAGDEPYYQLMAEDLRRTQVPPAVDRTRFTDLNAQAASAWLQASAALGEPALGEYATDALDRLLKATYEPESGVAHWHADDTDVRGLLTDQVHAAAALLDRHTATGDTRWSSLAGQLMRTALGTLRDEREGGFFDRVPADDDVGLLGDRVKPLAGNCLAARVLARLATLTGDTDLHQHALLALRAQTGTYRRHGLAGAPYAQAIQALFG